MGWKKSGSKWWYDQGGGRYPRSRWLQIGGIWYYFDSSGYMVTGWLKYGGSWYYLEKSGAMHTGWLMLGSKRYYLAESGVMVTGWFTDSDQKEYYFESSGEAVYSTVKKIGGKWYEFDKSAVMVANLTDSEGLAPLKVAISRNGTEYKGTWKLASAAKSSTSNKRYASMETIWELIHGNKSIRMTSAQSMDLTESIADIDGFDATSPAQTYSRASFYPYTDTKLDAIALTVVGIGEYVGKGQQRVEFQFLPPRRPVVDWSYDDTTGEMTAIINSDEGTDEHEWSDTVYMVEVKRGDGAAVTLVPWTITTETRATHTFDTSSYVSVLSEGQNVTFTVRAYSRGIAGDNPSASEAMVSTRTLGIPSAPVIKSVVPSSKDATGSIAVTIQLGGETEHVKLQRRHGEAGSWSDVEGAEDNGSASILYDSVGLAEPVDGEYLYYRAIASKDNFTTVGVPFRADLLYTSRTTTPSTEVGIISLEMSVDGDGAKIVVGWTEEKVGTSTEVSWSTDPQAWESNEQPKTFEITWEDDEPQSQSWQHSATLHVRGLTAGETYYFRARRVYADGDYSSYAQQSNMAPKSETASVSLTAPATVVRGEPLTVYWTYDGDLTQREYHIHPVDNPNIAYAAGTDTLGFASISPDRYGDAEVISLYVSVGVGGELTDSNAVTVMVLVPPTCEISCDPECQEQPFSFEVTSDTRNGIVGYKCTALGIVEEGPAGTIRQLAGDVIWTDVATPSWAISGSNYSATIQMPTIQLFDTGTYRIEATVTDPTSNLTSQAGTAEFVVAWEHQAAEPSSSDVTITPDIQGRAAQIAITAPDGTAEGDVIDLYRGSVEGFALIREGLPLSCTVTDRYASFGRQAAYRVAVRTTDGDVAWYQAEYDLPISALRFDWDGGFSEVTHSVQLNDTYTKGFEARQHLDGTTGGYWNSNVERKGSYSATSIKDYEDTNISALGNHHGMVYCRTANGHGFACNVDVSSENEQTSPIETHSLSITVVDGGGRFIPDDGEVTAP